MAVVLKIGAETLHDVRDPDRFVVGKWSASKNTVSTLDFTVYPSNPLCSRVCEVGCQIDMLIDGELRHKFTVESPSQAFDTSWSVTAVDELSWLERVSIEPFESSTAPTTVAQLFAWLIALYSEKATDRIQVRKNEGDILHKGTLTFESTQDATVSSLIKSLILDEYGGYLLVEYDNGAPVISLKADAAGVSHQTIEFGSNLLDYTLDVDGSSIVTCVRGESTYNDGDTDVTITLADADDGVYRDGYAKTGDLLVYSPAVNAYGLRMSKVTSDGISAPAKLVESCEDYLAANCYPVSTVSISSVDLHSIDSSVDTIELEDFVRVKSKPHGFDAAFECTKVVVDLNDPSENRYTLGKSGTSMSAIANQTAASLELSVGSVITKTDAISDEAKAAAQAAQTAQTAADTAQTAADSAQSSADSAQSSATGAQQTATEAKTTADAASATATDAKTTADSASTTATAAQSSADAASTAASAAQSTADSAATAASAAQTTADSASSAASSAQTSANAAQAAATTPSYRIVSNCSAISQDPSGACNPATLSCRSYEDVNTTSGTTTSSYYAGRFVLDGSADGSTWTNVYTSSSNSSLLSKAVSTIVSAVDGCVYARVTMYAAGGTTTQLSQSVISIVQATGSYIVKDSSGLWVTETAGDVSGLHAGMTSTGFKVMDGTTECSSFSADKVQLGENSTSSVIEMCGGLATIQQVQEGTEQYLMLNGKNVGLRSNNSNGLIYLIANDSGATAPDTHSSTFKISTGSDLAYSGIEQKAVWGSKMAGMQSAASADSSSVAIVGDEVTSNTLPICVAAAGGYKIFTGTVLSTGWTGNTGKSVWTPSEWASMFGTTYSLTAGFVAFAQGDASLQAAHVHSATMTSTGVAVTLDRAISGSIRLNYLVIVGTLS